MIGKYDCLKTNIAMTWWNTLWKVVKGTVMQIKKALINDRLRVLKVS